MTQKARKSINETLRAQVLARDDHRCRKCDKTEKLNLHHIIPVAKEQIDTLDNLITLCNHCHDEWEHIISAHTDTIRFHDWLKIPPALTLILAFSREEWWNEKFTAKDARIGVIEAFRMTREMRKIVEGVKDD